MTGRQTGDEAIARWAKRHAFTQHVAVYLLTNGFLLLIWWLAGDGGFFWPIFPIGAWGIGLVMHAWDAFVPGGLGEERIRRE